MILMINFIIKHQYFSFFSLSLFLIFFFSFSFIYFSIHLLRAYTPHKYIFLNSSDTKYIHSNPSLSLFEIQQKSYDNILYQLEIINRRLNDFDRRMDDFNYRLKLIEKSSNEHNNNQINPFNDGLRF